MFKEDAMFGKKSNEAIKSLFKNPEEIPVTDPGEPISQEAMERMNFSERSFGPGAPEVPDEHQGSQPFAFPDAPPGAYEKQRGFSNLRHVALEILKKDSGFVTEEGMVDAVAKARRFLELTKAG